MESEGSVRPSISFPLGLILLVVMLVSICGCISCCYNIDGLRNLFFQPSPRSDIGDSQSSADSLSHSITVIDLLKKPDQLQDQSLTVVMPGEEAPKYLAFPAPLTKSNV